jgi:electron transfer flavoprotein alpha/beta subunit
LVGPFDLILVGRNSVDADTGKVGPELAQLLDLPFVTGVKQLEVRKCRRRRARARHDEWVDASVTLPAVLSTAERLIDPCKIKDPEVWATVDPARVRRLTASDLGSGPWGQAGSPTRWARPAPRSSTAAPAHHRRWMSRCGEPSSS